MASQLIQAKEHFYSHIGVGYVVWKPMSLDDYQSEPLRNIENASTLPLLSATLKILNNHALRVGYFNWNQAGTDKHPSSKVNLHYLALDAMSLVIAESPASPYVSYGLSTVLHRKDSGNLIAAGPGYQMGAGLYLNLHRRIAFTAEYRFLYLMLHDQIGQTNNYSGPILSTSLHVCF
ncbi:MAG: hypothetical protein U5R06_07730 [candidate division KSB1 bacterium]|nr:hypothetical protein [candidate division KSB1 bacterium]